MNVMLLQGHKGFCIVGHVLCSGRDFFLQNIFIVLMLLPKNKIVGVKHFSNHTRKILEYCWAGHENVNISVKKSHCQSLMFKELRCLESVFRKG